MLNKKETYHVHKISCFSLVFLIYLISGCERIQKEQESDIIASVNGKTLTIENAEEALPDFHIQQDTVLALMQYRDQWIENQITEKHARSIGIDESEAYRTRLLQLENDLLKSMLKEKVLAENRDNLAVSDEEAQLYYQNNRDQFLLNERYVRFRHITTRTRADAESANRDLMNGLEWNQIIEDYSVNPEYQKLFSEEYWPESMVLADYPQLREYLSFIGITERSPITFEKGNFHFIQLMEEITEGQTPDLNWLIPQIKEWLATEKSRRMINGYIRNLYLQAESNNEIESADVNELEKILNQHQLKDK